MTRKERDRLFDLKAYHEAAEHALLKRPTADWGQALQHLREAENIVEELLEKKKDEEK